MASAQLSDKQLKKATKLMIGQGDGKKLTRVKGFRKKPCEDDLCKMKDPRGNYLELITDDGVVGVNGHGEPFFPPGDGIKPEELAKVGMRTSHDGRRILRSRRNMHGEDVGPPIVALEVEAIDHDIESHTPANGMGITTTDPPKHYQANSVNYKRIERTEEECKKDLAAKGLPEVDKNFLGSGITVHLCTKSHADDTILEPISFEKVVRKEMEPAADPASMKPPIKGTYTIKKIVHAAFPGQEMVESTDPEGNTMQFQMVGNQVYHAKFTPGKEKGLDAMPMPTRIESKKRATLADTLKKSAMTPKECEEYNKKPENAGKMKVCFVTKAEMKSKAGRRRMRRGEPIMGPCSEGVIPGPVREGCFTDIEATDDGKDSLADTHVHSTVLGHEDVPAPDGKGMMSTRMFKVESEDGDGETDLIMAETEGKKCDANGKCEVDPTVKGAPYLVQNVKQGTMKMTAQMKEMKENDPGPADFGNMEKHFKFKDIETLAKTMETKVEAGQRSRPPKMNLGRSPSKEGKREVDTAVVDDGKGSFVQKAPPRKLFHIQNAKPAGCSVSFLCGKHIMNQMGYLFKEEVFCACTGNANSTHYVIFKTKDSFSMGGGSLMFTKEQDRQNHVHTRSVEAHVQVEGGSSRKLLSTGSSFGYLDIGHDPQNADMRAKAEPLLRERGFSMDEMTGPVECEGVFEEPEVRHWLHCLSLKLFVLPIIYPAQRFSFREGFCAASSCGCTGWKLMHRNDLER